MNINLRDRPERVDSFLERWIEVSATLAELIWYVCIALAVVLVTIVSMQVFTRYVLGFVPLWGGELSRYIGIAMALLLMGPLVRQDRHLQVEMAFQRLSRRVRRIIRSIQLLLISYVGYLLFDWGLVYALEAGFGQESPSMDFQMFWVYLLLPIGGALLTFFSISKLIEINYYPETLDEDYEARFQVEAEQIEVGADD